MYKTLIAALMGVTLASGAFAQSQQYDEANQMMKRAGITFEIPATATEAQINEIIALGSTMRLEDPEAKFDFQNKVKQILGME
ncbi:MAG: hypothetical protein MUF63_14210 [Rhodobacteraceae bacterium]|nr:hypothetical protein [Paracoccaceae bacterium]